MRFALPASKFEGLQLCHQFFYDLMNLLEAISLNVAKQEVKKISRKILKAFAPETRKPQEALQIASPTNGGSN